MYKDSLGNEYECMYITEKGDKVFHHGTKEITGSKKEELDRIISETWDHLPLEKQIEINESLKIKRKAI